MEYWSDGVLDYWSDAMMELWKKIPVLHHSKLA